MLISAAAFAWQKPAAPARQGLITDGETPQYLYNVGSGMFFVGGNDYETRASLSATLGAEVKPKLADTGLYSIYNYVHKFKEFRKMFADGQAGIWVDNNNGANCDLWNFVLLENGNINIINDAYFGEYLGSSSGLLAANDTRLYLTTAEARLNAGGDDYDEWYSVNEEEYTKYVEANKTYTASQELKAEIDAAEAKYPSLDIADEKAVYNNEDSTVDQLKAAIASIIEKVKAEDKRQAEEGASLDDPKDLTSMIVNPSFEDGNTNGWTVKNSSDTGAKDNSNGTYHCDNADGNYLFNIWDWGYPITQKIEGLPNGVYSVGVMLSSSDDCTRVYQLANGCHKAVFLEENPNDGSKKTWMTQGNMIVRVTDRTLTIGAVGCGADNESYVEDGKWWYKADNFTLTYYGNKIDAFKYWVENGDDLGINIYDEDTKMTVSLREAYDEALAKFRASETIEEAEANLAALKALSAEVDENVQAWKDLIAKGDEAKKVAGDEDLACDEQGELSDYLELDFQDIIDAGELSTEDVKAEIENIEKMIEAVRTNGLKPGTDITAKYLKNVDFANGGANWTYSGGGHGGAGVAFNAAAKCAEGWNSANFDIHQEVNGLPEGYYSIQVQGFYRRGRGENAWRYVFDDMGQRKESIPEVPAFVYLNDNKTPLMYVFDYQVPVADNYYTGDFYKDPLGAFVYPNNMTDAGAAFDHDAYIMKAGGLVKKGETMRIGIKGSTNQDGDSWAIFTRFKLVYEGKYNVVVLKPALEEAIAALEKETIKAMASDVKAEALAVLADAQTALAGTSGEDMYKALEAITDVNIKIEASVALFTELNEMAETVNAKLSDSEASADVKTQTAVLVASIEMVMAGESSFTTAEAEKALADIKKANVLIAFPEGYEAATVDEPVEVTSLLASPSFQDAEDKDTAAGWQGDVPALGYGGAEFYQKTYNTYQALDYLPAGTYKVAVNAYYRYGSTSDDASTNKDKETLAKLYGQTSLVDEDNTGLSITSIKHLYEDALEDALGVGAEVTVTVDGETKYVPNNMQAGVAYLDGMYENTIYVRVTEDGKLTLGIKQEESVSNGWMMMDNWKLFYCGNEAEIPTAAEVVEAEVESATEGKFIMGNTIVIVKDGKMYNVAGVEVIK